MRILKDVMTSVRNSQRLSPGESLFKLVEKLRRKAPVTLAPYQQHGVVFELLQSVFHVNKRLPRRMRRTQRDVFHKGIHRRAVRPRIVRSEVAAFDGRRHPIVLLNGHRDRRSAERVEPLQRKRPEQRNPADGNPKRNPLRTKCCRIKKSESRKPFRQPAGCPHPDGSTPVVSEQSDLIQIELCYQGLKIRDMSSQRVTMPRRLAGQTASEMIDSDDSVSVAQSSNDVSPGEGPRWIPVNAEDCFARSFVDVMDLLTIDLGEVRLKRVFIRKAMFNSKLISSSHVPISKFQSLQQSQSNSAGYNF